MSWQIFIHSVRQVFGNLEGALRVSAVLTVLQIIVTFTIGQEMLMGPAEFEQAIRSGTASMGNYAIALLLLLLLSLWIAVGWHRYVLKNEVPAFVPRLYLDRIMGYFGKSILIGLLLLPVIFLMGTLVAFAFGPAALQQGQPQTFSLGTLILLLLYVPVGTIAMRLSAALPGVAMEPGVSAFAGWRATTGQTWTVMGVVLLSVIGAMLLGLPNMFLFAPGSVPGLIWQVVTQWVTVMVGASILTTLYGHYVEGRPLV
jgi:hypothetical protein